MSGPERIYLDNAATSWPKPPSVYDAVDHYLREVGAAAGRGAYREALEAKHIVDRTRLLMARFVGAKESESVIFTANGSDGLNLSLHGVLRPGDHVVTSDAEHNSILRPLAELTQRGVVDVTYVRTSSWGTLDPDHVRAALRPNTRLVAVTHASNVTGAMLPIEDIGKIVKDQGILFLVDAAQTLGHVPIQVDKANIDLLAGSGHKGLLGPLGTGILYVRPGVEQELVTIRQGGTGSFSDQAGQPDSMPDKLEVGNLNVPGLAGLQAGVSFLEEQGLESRRQIELEHGERLAHGIREVDGVTVYGPQQPGQSVSVLSLTIDGCSPQECASLLDAAFSIQVRAGLHCAPRMHRRLGTIDGGGTVRLSWGAFTSHEQVEAVIRAIQEIARA